jgi:acylglycerol lipase
MPHTQDALRTPAEYQGPRFDVAAEKFYSFDGAALGLSAWLPPPEQNPTAVIIGLHGMNDYARTFETAGPWFAARGVAVFAYDARGHGRSPNRGMWGGERLLTEDVRTAVNVARRTYPDATITVVGESMGAATALAAFGSSTPPSADRLVLVAPAVWGWSTLPEIYSLTLWAGAHTIPSRAVTPPRGVARRIQASDNIDMLRAIGRDPLMIFRTRVDAVYGLVDLMETASESAPRVHVPTAFMYGAHDQLVPRRAAVETAEALPAGARTALYPNGWHMMLRDRQAEVVYGDILAFIQDQHAAFPSGVAPLVEPKVVHANR